MEPDFAGRLNGFTLLFEAFILMLSDTDAICRSLAHCGRVAPSGAGGVREICRDGLRSGRPLGCHSTGSDETSRARGHSYVTLAADADARRVLFVTEGRDAKTIKELASYLEDHGCPAENITQVSIDMSPAFISGVGKHLPNARITFDKFHIIGHANAAVDKMRRIEQKTDKSLKGMRWTFCSKKTPPTSNPKRRLIWMP